MSPSIPQALRQAQDARSPSIPQGEREIALVTPEMRALAQGTDYKFAQRAPAVLLPYQQRWLADDVVGAGRRSLEQDSLQQVVVARSEVPVNVAAGADCGGHVAGDDGVGEAQGAG